MTPEEEEALIAQMIAKQRLSNSVVMVYQFIETDPPTIQDIQSAAEKGRFKGKCECLRSSLSCYKNIDFIREIHNSGGRFGSFHIAGCHLDAEMGRIEQTGNPAHHSLWLKKAALPRYFAMLEVQQ
jgi:hypothetical protein